jgi:hypothetical protein
MHVKGDRQVLAPHEWPKPVKHFLLTGATLLVILAYMLLCAGSTLLVAALLSQIRP